MPLCFPNQFMLHRSGGNLGRSYCAKTDLSEALAEHPDPDLVKAKMLEVHQWLTGKKALPDEDRQLKGWAKAYDLRAWENFPGDVPSLTGVLLQNLTFGMVGSHGGPTNSAAQYSKELRALF